MASSSSVDYTDKIDQYILVEKSADACWITDLGEVCKAFDSKLESPNRYVALLQLYEWCKHLPLSPILNNLIFAVDAARSISTSADKQPTEEVIVHVLNENLALRDAKKTLFTDEQGNPNSNIQHNTVNFVVMEWVEPLAREKLCTQFFKESEDAIAFVTRLANELNALYTRTAYVHLKIDLDHLKCKQNGDGVTKVVLNGLNFERVLDNQQRTAEQERNDVRLLAELLLQLLDGVKTNSTAFSTDLVTVKAKYANGELPGLWEVLQKATTIDSPEYENPGSFAIQLNSCLTKSPVTLEPVALAPRRVNTQPVLTAPQAQPQRTDVLAAKFDSLTIDQFHEGRRFRHHLFATPTAASQHADVLIEPIGQGPFEDMDHEQPGIDLEKHREQVRQENVFIHRHLITITAAPAGNSLPIKQPFYTVSDFSYKERAQRTILDDLPLSPLFAALFTPGSQLEIGNNYYVTLQQNQPDAPTGWSALSAQQRLSALTLHETHLLAIPGQNELLLPLTVTNLTNEVERLTVLVDGMPADWPMPPLLEFRLYDKESERKDLRLQLPAMRQAGEYELVVRLVSDNVDAQVSARPLRLYVQPHYEFTGVLQPEIVRNGNLGTIYVENHGNTQQNFSVTLQDKANELSFDPAQTILRLKPFATGEVGYRVYSPWHWLGREKRLDFQVMVTPLVEPKEQTRFPISISGHVINRAIIPGWVPVLLVLLLVGIFLMSTFLFVPDFLSREVSIPASSVEEIAANSTPVPVPNAIAGVPFELKWQSINSCFYSIYQNKIMRTLPQWQPSSIMTYSVKIANANDLWELRLHGCTFLRTRSWETTVGAAPTALPPTPIPPQNVEFSLRTANVESSGAGRGGIATNTGSQIEPEFLLVGQTGDLCIHWAVANKYDSAAYTLQIKADPPLSSFDALANIHEMTGDICLPIAQTFQISDTYTVDFSSFLTESGEEEQHFDSRTIYVQEPRCIVNTDAPLFLREGPGRGFPPRGEIRPKEEVYPNGRPLHLRDETEGDFWVPITLLDDPRPAWVAYQYLFCAVSIDPLPASQMIPPTPTPTPTITPSPTGTPLPTATPVPPPEASIEPPIINAGSCTVIKWKILNVREVYLNDFGVAGESELQECPKNDGTYVFHWRIVDLDGHVSEMKRTLIVNEKPTQ